MATGGVAFTSSRNSSSRPSERRARGRIHRAFWGVALVLTCLALLATLYRQHQGAVRLAPIRAMIAALNADPYQEKVATRRAVAAAAEAATAYGLASAEAWYAVGVDRAEKREFDGAETAFKNAIAIRPDWSWPHNELGILLASHTRHRGEEAERALRMAIRLEPQRGRPYNDLAILYRVRKRYDQAERAARLALQLSPESVAVNNNYGNLLVVRKRYSEAEPYYRKAIALAPDHPKPYFNLACLFCLAGRKEEALSMLGKAIALDPAIREEARKDPDLRGLRKTAEFRRLTAEPSQEGATR